jgi:hypothetical protein
MVLRIQWNATVALSPYHTSVTGGIFQLPFMIVILIYRKSHSPIRNDSILGFGFRIADITTLWSFVALR